MPETRLPISVAKPQALTQGNDRPETPCATDLRNRRTQAQLEGRNHITPTPYDILHDYISGPVFNTAVTEARQLCGQCPVQQACLRDNRDTDWVQALIRGPVAVSNGGERVKQAVAACGTDGGYYRHLRGTKTQPKSKPCDACRAAHAAVQAGRVEQQRVTCPNCGCLLLAGETCPKCAVDTEKWQDVA